MVVWRRIALGMVLLVLLSQAGLGYAKEDRKSTRLNSSHRR